MSAAATTPRHLTVCTIHDLRPSIFHTDDETWHGYEVDILTGFARSVGRTPDFRIVPFDRIWLRPKRGECDIAAAGITILPERARQGARFSLPIFRLDQTLLVRAADADTVRTLDDMSGRRIGVVPGTTGEISARRRAPAGAVFHLFDNEASMLVALRAGAIDAIARGTLGNTYQARVHRDVAVTGIEPGDEWTGFVTAPDDTNLAWQLDHYLRDLRTSGQLARLHRYWFPDLPVPAQLAPVSQGQPASPGLRRTP